MKSKLYLKRNSRVYKNKNKNSGFYQISLIKFKSSRKLQQQLVNAIQPLKKDRGLLCAVRVADSMATTSAKFVTK